MLSAPGETGESPFGGTEGNLLPAEYDQGDFYGAFTVHASIDSSRIEATCKNGVLTVHLPKVEAVKPRKINVREQ